MFSVEAERDARTPRSVAKYNLSRLLPIFTVLQRGDERQKYGVIEDSNKKPLPMKENIPSFLYFSIIHEKLWKEIAAPLRKFSGRISFPK